MADNDYDIRQHLLVPKHEKMNLEHAQEFLAKMKLERKQLPKISIKDPAIKVLEPQEGDIIKITRDSPTAGKTHFYRVVTA
ncbi:MAG TPA: DNA-directed RNA polymerase subunit H [Candidatus Nanoarchaeia archaeon]|nr:DNA-directed RNA polymerase subunit H [Candidatus Nanoarchaeia archaeon]